ncbi:kinesin-like protein KIF17 isoform X1 [Amphibalanus amphitrite]|uniref:kinesin-like protein KIF17 isoform X1 n=1 Tax=Amphibalanus amphitrite TaxID=1232801 RepID=UPI001C8FBE66|nr:kinesin-like protein KIF17 isoform X1 [Amphibalanus amphitrite]
MAESVKVLVRCRPMNSREKNLNCEVVVFMDDSIMQVSIVNPSDKNSPPKSFTFDGVYYMDSVTENIYKDMAYPLVEGTLEGYNGTIFAYGQTGCGKSFSMQGIPDPPTQLGLIPRAFEHIFDAISTSTETKYLVHGSYLEIYNEEIRDLLGNDPKKKIELKEHPEKGVYVQDLSRQPCHNKNDCDMLMQKGWNNRSTGETLMNKDSSRSHSIFTIFLEMITPSKKGKDQLRAGKLNLVDLAGSERQAKTGATGDRLKEATKINLSLSALGNVISALVDGKSKHIPYRDSKLTRLLQDSLGGNTKTMMVACLSPADNNYDETLSTLRYANRAKQIKNKPKINEDPKDALLREYQEEIKKLKEQLGDGGGPMTGAPQKVVDEEAIAQERERLRAEYEEEMLQMKKELEAQKKMGETNGVQAQRQKQMELEAAKIREEFIEREKKLKEELEHQKSLLTGGSIPDNADPEVVERLKELQSQMVGGEQANNKQALMKRKKVTEEVQRRRKEIAAALGRGAAEDEDDDEILVKAYDDVQATLKARTELAKKMKVRLRAQEQEIRDIQREFATERDDYLETIRRQDQQLKLMQQLMERVQPTIRKDCNYADVEAIKKQAVWDEIDQRWRLPDVQMVKTKLPPAGPSNFLAAGGGSLNGSKGSTSGRVPAQTAPARLGIAWDSDEEDKFLKRLEKGAEEDIAGQYFKPTGNRQAEILLKTQQTAEKAAKLSQVTDRMRPSGGNLFGMSFSHNALNTLGGFNGSLNGSLNSNSSMSSSWGNSPTEPPRLPPTFGLSSFSPERSRKPKRLAPVNDKKKNTMDFI